MNQNPNFYAEQRQAVRMYLADPEPITAMGDLDGQKPRCVLDPFNLATGTYIAVPVDILEHAQKVLAAVVKARYDGIIGADSWVDSIEAESHMRYFIERSKAPA